MAFPYLFCLIFNHNSQKPKSVKKSPNSVQKEFGDFCVTLHPEIKTLSHMRKSIILGAVAVVALALVACTEQQAQKVDGLVIEWQGVFSSGGRVTEPIAGEYDATQNWLDQERKGTTTHVDHANTLY